MADDSNRAKPVSALSQSLTGRSLAGGSSRPPSLPAGEFDAELGVSANTPSRSMLGASPEWRAPRPSSGAPAGFYGSSLGASFTAGHSFFMNSYDRRRPQQYASPANGAGASLAQEYSHDSGLAAPLLHGHSPAGAGGGPPSRLGSRQPSLAGPSAGPPGGYAPPQLAAAAAAAAAHDEALDDFPSAFPAAGAGAAILGSPSAGAGAAAAAKAFAAADAAAEAGARPSARVTGIIYGIINGVVGLPCMIGFAAVIFSDPMYKPMLGDLARFSFLAAAVHQTVFTLLSTIPFAVGQPQDVGLIFLSSMATGVAEIGREVGLSLAEIVGTALLTIMVATIVVGLLTYTVAKFKLATLVQYVPLPVVGGYLGYVGYFCLAAGLGLGTGVQLGSFSSWLGLLAKDPLIKLCPTLVTAAVVVLTMQRARSPWALPALLVALPLMFHAVLLATGVTLEQAQDAGWALKPQGKSTKQFWELYEMFNIKDLALHGIYLPALIRQLPKILGLFFVVTFGSCLDVAAIQADVPVPIDFNRELATVGISNIVCGLTGSGYTGSYIFSQTIFSMRAGVTDRVHGWVIAFAEMAVFLLPVAVAQYLPLYFYGALLAVFGVEIAGDWLIHSRHKVTRSEYILLLATFLAIMQFELEMGVLIGIVLCLVSFAVTYARMNITAFTVLPSRSVAVRTYRERLALAAFQGRSVAVGLSGYLFFGSSVLLTEKVTKLAEEMVAQGADAARAILASGSPAAAAGGAAPRAALPPKAPRGGEALNPSKLAALVERAPCFVLLDFRRVLGVDATAAQLLGSLQVVLRQMGVELVLTRVRDESVRRLFVAHGLVAPGEGGRHDDDTGAFSYCQSFPTLSDGEQYVEDRFLEMVRAAGLLGSGQEALTLQEFLAAHAEDGPLAQGLDVAAAAAGLAEHSASRNLEPGALLFDFDGPPDAIYLVLSGAVDMAIKHFTDGAADAAPAPGGAAAAPPPERHLSCGPGAVFGGTDFVLQRPRTFRAAASAPSTVVVVDKDAYSRMAAAAPQAAAFLQIILLRDAALSESHAYEVLERALAA